MASLFLLRVRTHVGFTKKIPHLKRFRKFQTNLNLYFITYLSATLKGGIYMLLSYRIKPDSP